MPRSAWIFRAVAKAMGIDLFLEQFRAPWLGNPLEEEGNIKMELGLLKRSPWLLERSLGAEYRIEEDMTKEKCELQEMMERAGRKTY